MNIMQTIDHIRHILGRLALIAMLAVLLPGGAWAAGGCSASVGKVTLNEYNYIDNFTEIDKLDSSVDLTNWKVTIYTPNGHSTKSATANLPATGSNSCTGGQYQVSTFNANDIGTDADAVLFDAAGNIVDVLRVRPSLPVTTTYYGALPTCSFKGSSTDLAVSSGHKGVDRLPDGVGDWRQTPGTGSNSLQSKCASNVSSADMSITKTASASTVANGAAVTFTLTVTNNGSDTAGNVVVNDALPTGFIYSNSSATVGSYSSSTGNWTIGTMTSGQVVTLTMNVTAAAVGTITNTATVSSSASDTNTANNSASVSVIVTSAGSGLDAVEVGAASGTAIHTKVAGQSFNLDVLALSSGSIATSYNKAVTVELVDASSSATCSSMTLLQSVGSYTFTGSGTGKDNGRKTFAFTYANAAKNVKVRMKDTSTPITACSTDNFAIRPASLASVSVTDANWTTAGTARTLNNSSLSSSTTHKAGQPLTVSVTAYNAASGVTSNYNGSPTVTVSACSGSGTACTSSFGTFALGSWSASSGIMTATANYDQVGAFGLQFQDQTFADVDLNDGSTTTERYVPASTKIDVGRFVPDHFDVSYNTPEFTSACSSGFTYLGQAFSYTSGKTPLITITAKNAGNNTTTLYTGTLWRLTAPTGTYSVSAGTLATTSTTATVTDTGSGVGTLGFASPASLTFTRNATLVAPFNAEIQLAATIADTDGVTYSGNPATFGASGNGIAFNPTTGKTMRFGRLKLSSAYGSELLPLPVPVEAQYWTGTYWATNTLDNCTSIAAANLLISSVTASLTSLASPLTLASGKGSLILTKPSATGSATLCVDVGPNSTEVVASSPLNCNATTSLGKSYLQGNTYGVLYDDDPQAKITFGVYKNANEFIYLRENY